MLASSTLALSQLAGLADSAHRQNLLWCLGAHAAALEMLRVLSEVERSGASHLQARPGPPSAYARSLRRIRLQPPSHTVAACAAYGCSLPPIRSQARLPPEAVKGMRESAFALLCAFCEGNKRNQAVLFGEFSLVLAHMCNVRKATSCARLVLQALVSIAIVSIAIVSIAIVSRAIVSRGIVRKATCCARLVPQDHAENCAAVTRAQLTQLMGLMSEGSARSA